MNEELKLLREFEKKFGFEAYEGIKEILSKLYLKVQELKKSRDKWREKYYGKTRRSR
jgi:hypothetical protein